MTAAALPVTRRALKMLDEAIVRDTTYQQTPIGRQVKRWLDVLQWEDHSPNTLAAYAVTGICAHANRLFSANRRARRVAGARSRQCLSVQVVCRRVPQLVHRHRRQAGTTQVYLHPTTDDLDRRLAVVEAAWQEALVERRVRYGEADLG